MWLMLPSGPAAWGGAALGALARGASERAPPPSCCAAAPETELPVILGECALKGRGVFAAAAVAEGGFVCEYVGDVLSLAEVEEVYAGDSEPEYLFALPHGAQQTAHLYLDAAKSEHWSRYLNHAYEEASCLVQAVVGEESCDGSRTGGGSGVGRNAGARLAIRAARQIAVGEELTFDYGLSYWAARSIDPAPGTDSRRVELRMRRAARRIRKQDTIAQLAFANLFLPVVLPAVACAALAAAQHKVT